MPYVAIRCPGLLPSPRMWDRLSFPMKWWQPADNRHCEERSDEAISTGWGRPVTRLLPRGSSPRVAMTLGYGALRARRINLCDLRVILCVLRDKAFSFSHSPTVSL